MQRILLALLLLTLTGCASLSCPRQLIYIETPAIEGAECFVSNDLGSWYVPCTPMMISVYKSPCDLMIRVQKPGYVPTLVYVKARPNFGRLILLRHFINRCAPGCSYPDAVRIPLRRCYE